MSSRGPLKTQYDAETLVWCEQRSFENCCLFFRDELSLIHQDRHCETRFNKYNRRKMRELGILVSRKGHGQYNALTEKAIIFLGFTKKESQKMTKNTPLGAYLSSPKGQPVPIERNTRVGGKNR